VKKSCAKNSLGSNTTKNKCVVLVSPFFRVGHIADLSKKYKFTPIVILSKNHDACGEEYQTIYENAQIIKKRNPNTIIITDNGKEFEKVVKELSKYDVEAIIPYEMSGKYVERLRERLKLKGNDLKLAFKRNKKWVNEQLEKNKLNVPKTIEYKFSELVKNSKVCFKRIAKEIKIPFVMKPLEGYGSVGTSVIKNENEFLKAVKTLDELAGKYKTIVQKLLFQEYIGGDEYIFNYQSIDGEHILTDA
jgi:glutathione synthase/RimK-type ligase-like ATP-grasp enzyme